MPLISLRWYQLAINRSHANACLSGQGQPYQRTSLMICVDAACALLFSVSIEACDNANRVQRYRPYSVALGSLVYTVDYHWVIYAFAAAFLALAYQRGAIGGTFSDRTLEEAGASSLLSRLLGLGVDLFDQACAGSSNHSAGQYCEVLRSLVKATCAPGEAIEVSHESGGDGGSSNAFGSLQGLDMEFLNQLGLNGYTYTDFRDSVFSFASMPGAVDDF